MSNLPTPDFTFDPNEPGVCIAGVRPYRNGSYRLDAETASGKFIIHNYGHGGAGISLSWGCAAKVRDILQQHLVNAPDQNVAVLGAGVVGLTAATLLLDLGVDVTIYSDRKPVDTTSFKAGGQWAVSVVEFNLQYLYGQDGYMFPRADHVVIGGTFEVGVTTGVLLRNCRPNSR
jgi:hypothetical protein